jgi:hypothetical protein
MRRAYSQVVRIRTVETIPVQITTSAGSVSGEFWSDRLVGIGLVAPDGTPIADRDQHVNSPTDLAALIASLGVPESEAESAATAFWTEHVAPVWNAWADREARRDGPSLRQRVAGRFGKPS